jgi:hypothetical protein
MIAARQATPGTKVIVSGWRVRTRDLQLGPEVSARCAVCGRAFANRAHSPSHPGAHEFTSQPTATGTAPSADEGGRGREEGS